VTHEKRQIATAGKPISLKDTGTQDDDAITSCHRTLLPACARYVYDAELMNSNGNGNTNTNSNNSIN